MGISDKNRARKATRNFLGKQVDFIFRNELISGTLRFGRVESITQTIRDPETIGGKKFLIYSTFADYTPSPEVPSDAKYHVVETDEEGLTAYPLKLLDLPQMVGGRR